MANFSSVRSGRGRSHRRGESRRTGQWKLAYADFLTALMAFFLLMWLSTSTSMAERAAIAEYFGGSQTAAISQAEAPALSAEELEQRLVEKLSAARLPDASQHIAIETLPDGLRIELTDTAERSPFDSGASTFNADGEILADTVGTIIADLSYPVRVEGHTDAFKTTPGSASNWTISSARANAALTRLTAAGVTPDRFSGVVGLADTVPLLPTRPHAAANRRISIVLELS